MLILLQFYRSIAEYFGLPGQLASRSSSYIAWTQHFANLAEKVLNLIKRTRKYAEIMFNSFNPKKTMI